MRIVYAGTFLGEGLRRLGHEVIPLHPDPQKPFALSIRNACPDPDLVLLELWGKTEVFPEIADCDQRIAAYCIDSPLNIFWLRHYLPLCEDVFVDQRDSVGQLARDGINATWLPLCAFETDFVAPREKDLFLTFVGRVTDHRLKRRNLLDLLRRHVPITIVEGVDRQQMQALFARSHIVLNENLFSGLTLRVFQALASGALLLTEAGGDGVDVFFKDGEDLLCYEPGTILDILSDLQRDTARADAIASHGRALCHREHTSEARARAFLAAIGAGPANPVQRATPHGRIAQAMARYFHALRYGGHLAAAVRTLARHAGDQSTAAHSAAHLLGSFQARRGDLANARKYLSIAAQRPGTDGCVAAAKLALTFLYHGDPAAAVRILTTALARLPGPQGNWELPTPGLAPPSWQEFFLLLSRVLLACGRVHDLGLLKPRLESYPDNAFEYARLAWDQGHTAAVLDTILACAEASGTRSEVLPTLKTAITEGIATDRQMLYAAELAHRLYDTATAETILASFRTATKQAHPPKRQGR